MKKLILTMVAAITAVAAQAVVNVINVNAQQRYPWNGMVDIDYTVVCDNPDADVWVFPVGYDKDRNKSMSPRSITGQGVIGSVKPGTYRMTWNVAADYPGFAAEAFSVKITAMTGGSPYMVVDISGGTDAHSYPVRYLNNIPEGGWTDAYKTTNIVLRLIPPGSFMMGSAPDELGRSSDENLHSVTLTKPYYIGIFEVTQKQYELVMGSLPSSLSSYSGDTRPVGYLTYADIRGSVNGTGWPTHNQVDADSFMGRMRAKANVHFDLPTEAQWEYACRAGTGTSLNSGKNLTSTSDVCTNLNEVARNYINTNDGKGGYNRYFTAVGSYLPNTWGLYDMHGNAHEFCLDYYSGSYEASSTDPKGSTSTDSGRRILRGGATSVSSIAKYRSAARTTYGSLSISNDRYACGFRAVCLPVD